MMVLCGAVAWWVDRRDRTPDGVPGSPEVRTAGGIPARLAPMLVGTGFAPFLMALTQGLL